MNSNKHPFIGCKLKKTVPEELDLVKEKHNDKFYIHIENYFKDEDNYYIVRNKKYAKYEDFKTIFKGEN